MESEFVVANTDAQALAMSSADRRIQMGTNLTEGLGAVRSQKLVRQLPKRPKRKYWIIRQDHMVFITAGMGGGTEQAQRR